MQETGVLSLIRKIPWCRNGTPLLYSCLKKSIGRGAWWTIVLIYLQSVRHNWATEHRHTHTSQGRVFTLIQFSSVAQSCPALCDPMDCSTPGYPVHHQLPELAQTHVHWVIDYKIAKMVLRSSGSKNKLLSFLDSTSGKGKRNTEGKVFLISVVAVKYECY